MTSYEDIEELIQEWFGECLTVEDVARLYAQIRIEIEKQFTHMLTVLSKSADE